MSRVVIAGNPVFFVPPGVLLELCRSRGALSQTKWFPTSGRSAWMPPGTTGQNLFDKPYRMTALFNNYEKGFFRT